MDDDLVSKSSWFHVFLNEFVLLTTCFNPSMIVVIIYVYILPINIHSFFIISHSNLHSLILFPTFLLSHL